jgi:hypothetical protein
MRKMFEWVAEGYRFPVLAWAIFGTWFLLTGAYK